MGAGFVVFAATRGVGMGRTRWSRELAASIVTAVIFGVVATALDFGGWNEADWRAGVFALCGALTAIAVVRLTRLTRRDVSDSASDEPAAG